MIIREESNLTKEPTILRVAHARLASGRLSRNAVFAIGQSLFVTLNVFLVYRLLIEHVGIERVGVWSLLLAASSVLRIGDVSGAGALTRFVALNSRNGNTGHARDYVHTLVLTSLGSNAVLGMALYLAAPSIFPQFILPRYLADAEALVPFVIITMVIGAVGMAVTSGIDGVQRADQRAVAVSLAATAFLGTNWLLVPRFGVVGFGVAQVLQQVILLALGWWVLRRHVPNLGWLPHHWRRDVFVETIGYALKLNGIGIAGLISEPLIKLSCNVVGGPSFVGYYELASRLVIQVRALVIAAASPLVAAFAEIDRTDPALKRMLEQSTRIIIIAAVGMTFVSLVGALVMTLVVLGAPQREVLLMSSALAFGWGVQLPCLAFYLAAQAQGLVRWNFIGHLPIALSAPLGTLLLASSLGPPGLIASVVAGLLLSAIAVLLGNGYSLGVGDVLQRLRRQLLVANLAMATLCVAAGMGFAWISR